MAAKRGKEIKEARPLTYGYCLYRTSHYALYGPALRNTGTAVTESFRYFSQYNGYTLYCNPTLESVRDILKEGVRLDDMTAAFVLMTRSQSVLHDNWPAEFDHNGMIRATRAPLGFAAKFWKKKGDKDIDGHVLTKAEEGYYYMWWRNIHCLCGDEGLKAGLFKIRPSFEQAGPVGFNFKVTCRAVV